MPRTKLTSWEEIRNKRLAVLNYCFSQKGVFTTTDKAKFLGCVYATAAKRDDDPGLYTLSEIQHITKGVELTENQLKMLIGGVR